MLIICLLLFHIFKANASTHWVVTEDGRIQQQLESPFAMKKPEDLVTLMRQESTDLQLKKIKEKLLKEQEQIELNEDKDTELESRHYRTDLDCRAAGKRLPDFDLFISSVLPLDHKGIEVFDHISRTPEGPYTAEPNCTAAYPLPYSIHAYDHLKGVQERRNLPHDAMTGLKATLEFLEDDRSAATVVNEALQKNKTSWVLYNLASFYWRMKGNPNAAIECIRRALHFSPEDCKDVALVNLANILHRAHYTLNATAVMHHALDVSEGFNVNFFSLANMYAVLGEYNESIFYYEETLKGQPDFKAAKSRLAAVKCQYKLQEKLELQHKSLERTLEELQKYKVKHESFVQSQNRFNSVRLPVKTQVDQHMHYEHQRIKEGTFNHKCQVRTNKSGSVLVCNIPTSSSTASSASSMGDVQYVVDVVKPVPAEPLKVTKHETSSTNQDAVEDVTKDAVAQVAEGKENKEQVEKQEQDTNGQQGETGRPAVYDWRDPSWPPMESCDKYIERYPAWDEFPSAYLDPETRGFKVRDLLTSYIGIADGEMHPQPWNLPDCVELEATDGTPYDVIAGIASRETNTMHKEDSYLQNCLLTHVNKGRVWPDDLGQRILTAIHKAMKQKDNDHLWVLYNLAGLFWRVNGNNLKAIECLRRCLVHVPAQHSDVPLVSLSNIMYRIGKLNDAVNLLIYALRVNNSEPTTYLSMGNALQAQENITGAVEFYNYAMVLHPQYKEAFHSLLVVKCYNLKQKKHQERVNEFTKSFNNNLSEPSEEVVQSCVESDVACKTETSTDNDQTEKQGDSEKLPEANPTDPQTDEIEDKKSIANELLSDAGNVINDLINSNGGEIDDKLLSAKKLMKKLSEMRDTLGNFVHAAVDIISKDDDDLSTTVCEEVLSSVDLNYTTTRNDLFWQQSFDDVTSSDNDAGDPTCSLESPPEVYDLDELQVIDRDQNLNIVPDAETLQNLQRAVGVESLEDLSKTIASQMLSNPTSWKMSMLASYVWRAQGDARQMLSCLLRSVVIAPVRNHELVLFSLADFLARLARFTDALHIAKHALALNSASPSLHFLIANIYAAAEDYVNSTHHYTTTLRLNENYPDCQKRLHASRCLEKRTARNGVRNLN